VLLGVTGSGKTFTMAKVIEALQRPALILAPNKILAAQLVRRIQELLPRKRGRVFRQLLRLLPARSLCAALRYLHREGKLGERGDRPDAPLGHPRAAGTRRRDHRRLGLVPLRHRLGRDLFGDDLRPQGGRNVDQREIIRKLVALQYKRNDAAFTRGNFRVRGDSLEIFPSHYEDMAWRVSFFGDEIEAIANSIR
jgi:excinuclease ABC subunit B